MLNRRPDIAAHPNVLRCCVPAGVRSADSGFDVPLPFFFPPMMVALEVPPPSRVPKFGDMLSQSQVGRARLEKDASSNGSQPATPSLRKEKQLEHDGSAV